MVENSKIVGEYAYIDNKQKLWNASYQRF